MNWLKERRARRHKSKQRKAGHPDPAPQEASTLDFKTATEHTKVVEKQAESPPNPPKATHTAAGSETANLWGQALDRLNQRDENLVSKYKGVLIDEGLKHGKDASASSDQLLGRIVTNKLDEIEKAQLTYTLNGTEHSVNKQFGKVIRGILGLKEYITVAVSPDPQASLAWSGVLVILPVLLRPWTEEDEARDGFTYIADYLIRCKVIEDEYRKVRSNRFLSTNSTALSNRQNLQEAYIEKTIELYTQILEYQIRLLHHLSRSGLIRVFADLARKDGWKDLADSIKETEKDVVSVLNDLDRTTLHNIDQGVETIYELGEKTLGILNKMQGDVKILREEHDDEKIHRMLERLSQLYITGASFESERAHKSCLPGTRVSLLDRIQEWTKDCQGRQIFWVNGIAGTGKSTIAKTVASTLAEQGRLGASYFFLNGSERGRAQLFFRTLAVQLVQSQPATRPYIARAVGDNIGIDDLTLEQQWRELLCEPLKQCSLPDPIVLVIDALDECDTESDIKEILECLAHTSDVPYLRIFITGRPRLARFFNAIRSSLLQIVNLSEVDGSEKDISRFLKYRLGEIKDKWSEEDANWPDNSALLALEHKAGKLFIYASTACSFVDNFYYKNRLLEILENDRPGLSELDKLYTKALEKALPTGLREGEKRQFVASFCDVVGAIVVLFEPLTVFALGQLLGQGDVKLYVSRISSVLDVADADAPIRTFHLSFRDFLLDSNRQDKMFWVDEIAIHRLLADRCLEILSTTLEQSIFDLNADGSSVEAISFEEIKQHLPPHVQYACLHLARHVEQSGTNIDSPRAAAYMRDHLLQWLKALDLLQRLRPSTQMSRTLNVMERTFHFASDGGDYVKTLIQIAGEKKDYSTLLLLITMLWNSRDVMRSFEHSRLIKLGRMLISLRYLCGESTAAVRLAEDITYNLQRIIGRRNSQTSDMAYLVSRLYTSIGQGLQTQSWDLASIWYTKAAVLHANSLFSLSEPSDYDYFDDDEDDEDGFENQEHRDVNDQIRHHWYLLRLAIQRLGSWPEKRVQFARLRGIIAAHPTVLRPDDSVENWDLERFGLGRAEADDDLFVPELKYEEF